MRKRWVGDVIKDKDIEKWRPEVPVIISAQTGQGKTHFIKNTLYNYAKERGQKILLLVHRVPLRDQIEMELVDEEKTDVITLMTYQKIDNASLNYRSEPLDYDYIVSDEFHYFLSDAGFNHYTDLSFKEIMHSRAVKIFMSATEQNMCEYIESMESVDEFQKYEMPRDYSYIESLTFFTSFDLIKDLPKKILRDNSKAIYFVNDISKGVDLYKSYKDKAMFCCSKNGNQKTVEAYKNYVDPEKVKTMLREERFEENFLITTSVMDAGVNIKDKAVKSVIVDIKDLDVMIQCIGRKRSLDKSDKIHLYIRNVSNRELNGFVKQGNDSLIRANYLKDYDEADYHEAYRRQPDPSGIVYEDQDSGRIHRYLINEMMFTKVKNDIRTWRKIMYENGKNNKNGIIEGGWCKYIARLLGKYDEENEWYKYDFLGKEKPRKVDEIYMIEQYLKQMAKNEHPMPTNKDRKKLIDVLNVRRNGRKLKGIHMLNGFLRDNNIPYEIVQYRAKINGVDRKKAWRIREKDWDEIS